MKFTRMKRVLQAIFIAVAAALPACGGGEDFPFNASQAQTAPQSVRRILGIGDSIMAGYIPGDGVSQRLAQQESFMRELAPFGQVVGSPVGGASTKAALDNQVAWAMLPFDPASSVVPPDIVVIMLGTNDAVLGASRAESLSNVKAILASFPNSIRVVASPPHWSEAADAWMGPWARELQALASETGSYYADTYTPSLGRPWQCTTNNRHPCEAAHREMGRLIAATVKTALAKP